MKLLIDPRVNKQIKSLSKSEYAKVEEYIILFKEFGFSLGSRYLKKIKNKLWELRPSKYRLFLTEIKTNYVAVHFMRKKSQKITKETLVLINHRLKEYKNE